MRFACAIEYLGTEFSGWQKQVVKNTVQEICENAFSKIADHEVTLVCAGRTDRGVHATCQVVHFDTKSLRKDDAWVRGSNGYLPSSIKVKWVKEVDDTFHARFSALSRSYRYIIWNDFTCSALLQGLTSWCYTPIDIAEMQNASKYLLGTHDFSSFRSAGCQAKTPIRTIESISIHRNNACVVFDITANGFLQNMVRIIIGCLLEVGTGRKSIHWVETVLQSKDRKVNSKTMTPNGLYLTYVKYHDRYQLPLTMPIVPTISLANEVTN
ncbi:MAG: tRNA pseudouridine(38-40) synthase TruA [Methylacidiphilales bacterium]|nr:tRNA pseudouridine(38-40) synthase TruA [Candidatus Methylacidiphilales bacterium]